MRTTALRVACLGLIVAGSGLIVASAKATGSHHGQGQECNLGTLDGFYVFSANGSQETATGNEPLSVAGYEIFDGHGGVRGKVTVSQGGALAQSISFTGCYTVNADCSGTLTIPALDKHFDQFIEPTGKTFTWIETDDGVSLAGFEVRSDGQER